MLKSKMGNSKLGGKQLMDKIKAKSRFADTSNLDNSKMMMDRSQMLDRSRQMEASRSKIKEDKSKINKNFEKKQVEEVRNFSKKKESPVSQLQTNIKLQSPKKKEIKQMDRGEEVTVKK